MEPWFDLYIESVLSNGRGRVINEVDDGTRIIKSDRGKFLIDFYGVSGLVYSSEVTDVPIRHVARAVKVTFFITAGIEIGKVLKSIETNSTSPVTPIQEQFKIGTASNRKNSSNHLIGRETP